ncbi:hypothetical protein [Chryseobacterium sp. HR92]|uniref:hypothetical protein n=1 Tax=Chryseobacterium sp. HR92 TaxID=3094839 RepID=UPI00388FD87A|nr:hypothetical protein SFA27_03450 [Chryseobacterium sp. HR92]
MRNLFLCTVLALLSISCKKDDVYFQTDTGLQVFISNGDNVDLLDEKSEIADKVDLKKLKIISSGNNDKNPSPGKGKLVPDIISSDYFRIENKSDRKCLVLIFDPIYSESILKINYNNGLSDDILTADLVDKNGKVVYNKIYLNKVLIWDAANDKDKSIYLKKGPITHIPCDKPSQDFNYSML